MGHEREASFDNMTMSTFHGAVLFMGTGTGQTMDNTNGFKKFVDFTIFNPPPPPTQSDCTYFIFELKRRSTMAWNLGKMVKTSDLCVIG